MQTFLMPFRKFHSQWYPYNTCVHRSGLSLSTNWSNSHWALYIYHDRSRPRLEAHCQFVIKIQTARVCYKLSESHLFMKMAADLVRFESAHFNVWKWSKSMEYDSVFVVYIESKAIFIHPISDFSVTTKFVWLGITIGDAPTVSSWRHSRQARQK